MTRYLAGLIQALRPNEAPERLIVFVFLVLFMLNIGQAPVGGSGGVRHIGITFAALLLVVVLRNLQVAAIILYSLNVTYRLGNQISHWTDQIFVQNYGLSAALSGVNIYSAGNLAEHPFGYYLPMGTLFGSLPIYLGIHNYWNFYHILVPLLLLIPFVHSPTLVNLVIFVVSAFFFPLVDYTTGGGNVELSYAFLIPGVYLLLKDKGSVPALVLLAFGIMLRQPAVFLIPFVLVILLGRKKMHLAWVFVGLLFAAGGWYILRNPSGFLSSAFLDSAPFQEIWYKRNGGLTTNFSVSTVLKSLGVSDPWSFGGTVYLIGMLATNACLFLVSSFAFARGKIGERSYLGIALVSVMLVYALSRGFVFLHYLMSACFVFLALYCTEETRAASDVPAGVPGRYPPLAVYYTRAIATVVGALIAFPLAMTLLRPSPDYRTDGMAAAFLLEPPGGAAPTPVALSSDRVGASLPVGGKLVVELPKIAYVDSVHISGERFLPVKIEGVEVRRYPSSNQSVGFIKQGTIWGSADGTSFFKIRDFENAINYHVFPVRLSIKERVKTIKIEVRGAYDNSKVVVFGNVIVTGE